VDSSVAAALLREAGHDVTGVTLKLWGGESDSGCCSVADVEDALPRRSAHATGTPRSCSTARGTTSRAVATSELSDA
jgi:tRNA-specific 2-thiouridylase